MVVAVAAREQSGRGHSACTCRRNVDAIEISGDSLSLVAGGLSMLLKNRAADLMHALRADAIGATPKTEADLAMLRKASRFFKTLVDGHLREE